MNTPVSSLAGLFLAAVVQAAEPVQESMPPGVTWINPPGAGEVTAPGREKFIVLVREPVDPAEPCDWNFVAAVWEIVPDPVPVIVPRVRLSASHWSPGTLLWEPSNDHRGLLRLQVPLRDQRSGYTTDLFRIHCRTWIVNTLWQGANVRALFEHGPTVYVEVVNEAGEREMRILRPGANGLEPLGEPLRYVRSLEHNPPYHLVQRRLAPPGVYDVFDARSESLVATCRLPEGVESGRSEVVFSEDFAYVAVQDEFDYQLHDWHELHTWSWGASNLRVIRAADGEEARFPIGVMIFHGSGDSSVRGPCVRFTGPRMLRFRSFIEQREVPQAGAHEAETFELDLGAPNPAPNKVADGDDCPARPWQRRTIEAPDYLHQHLDDNPDEHDIAHAFLRFKDVDFTVPAAWCDSVTAFSDDGERFAIKMVRSGRDDVFFLGDLRQRTLREILAPAALWRANDMSMLWVAPK